MNDRARILKQKCNEYRKKTSQKSAKLHKKKNTFFMNFFFTITGITPTTSRHTMTVLEDYVGKFNLRSVRYDPRYSFLYCMQHKQGHGFADDDLWRFCRK